MAKYTPEEKQKLLAKLNIEQYPKNKKGHYIIPDNIFDANYQILPDGTTNKSGTWRSYGGGKMHILGTDPERDRAIQKKGGEALQATIKQRRTFAETVDIMLRNKARPEDIERFGLPEGATIQDALIASMATEAIDNGNAKAFVELRNTAGEMPAIKQEINAEIITERDKALIEKLSGLLSSSHNLNYTNKSETDESQ